MMRSESTSALGQPRETKETLGAGAFMGGSCKRRCRARADRAWQAPGAGASMLSGDGRDIGADRGGLKAGVLRRAGASPPPCGEGLGVGVGTSELFIGRGARRLVPA